MHNAANSALGANPARDRAQPKCATNDREMGSSITFSGGLTIILSKNFPVDLFSEMEARTCLALHGVEAGFGFASRRTKDCCWCANPVGQIKSCGAHLCLELSS